MKSSRAAKRRRIAHYQESFALYNHSKGERAKGEQFLNLSNGKVCNLIIDGGSCTNIASTTPINTLDLPAFKHF